MCSRMKAGWRVLSRERRFEDGCTMDPKMESNCSPFGVGWKVDGLNRDSHKTRSRTKAGRRLFVRRREDKDEGGMKPRLRSIHSLSK